jgi:CheY-like chemotaxis protein
MGQTLGDRTNTPKDVLVVDDNAADTQLLEAVFRDLALKHRLHIVTNGEQALSFVHRQGSYAAAPRPDVVLLDLNLPRLSGRDVLQHLKQHATLRTIPVMVFSSSAAESDVLDSYALGANAYLVKPFQLDELVELVRKFVDFWFVVVTAAPSD